MNGRRLLGSAGLLALALLTSIWIAAGAALASGGGLTPAGSSAGGGEGASAFPVRGHHTYGDGIGAGRGHEGQDIMADCGKKVVAARAGRVRVVDYQASGAGHYVVIKGKGRKDYDYVHMHMPLRTAVRRDERELILRVGSTGPPECSCTCAVGYPWPVDRTRNATLEITTPGVLRLIASTVGKLALTRTPRRLRQSSLFLLR